MSIAKSNAKVCASKVTYSSRKEAITAAVKAFRRYGGKLSAYKCRACSKWHIGHRSPKKKGLVV